MAADPEAEKLRDLARLDSALDKIEKILTARAPNEAHPTFVQALETAQLKAIDRIVPLLERRAAMLGYDAPKAEAGKGANQSGTLAELEQKLALVARARQGGSS